MSSIPSYVEGIPTRWLLPSLALTLSLALSALAGITGLLKLLVWAVGPKQGEGPTREVMERGEEGGSGGCIGLL